jgi:hypothetical protein
MAKLAQYYPYVFVAVSLLVVIISIILGIKHIRLEKRYAKTDPKKWSEVEK